MRGFILIETTRSADKVAKLAEQIKGRLAETAMRVKVLRVKADAPARIRVRFSGDANLALATKVLARQGFDVAVGNGVNFFAPRSPKVEAPVIEAPKAKRQPKAPVIELPVKQPSARSLRRAAKLAAAAAAQAPAVKAKRQPKAPVIELPVAPKARRVRKPVEQAPAEKAPAAPMPRRSRQAA